MTNNTKDETPIKLPVVYDNGKLGPMIVDGEGLSIAVAAFADREQQALEHIAKCINSYPEQEARIKALEAALERIKNMDHVRHENTPDDAEACAGCAAVEALQGDTK